MNYAAKTFEGGIYAAQTSGKGLNNAAKTSNYAAKTFGGGIYAAKTSGKGLNNAAKTSTSLE